MSDERFDWRVTVEVSGESHAFADRKIEIVGSIRCEAGDASNYGVLAARKAIAAVAGQTAEGREGYDKFDTDGVTLASAETFLGGTWSSSSNS